MYATFLVVKSYVYSPQLRLSFRSCYNEKEYKYSIKKLNQINYSWAPLKPFYYYSSILIQISYSQSKDYNVIIKRNDT